MIFIKNNFKIVSLTILFIVSIILNIKIPSNYLTIILMIILTTFSGYNIFKNALIDLRYLIININLLVVIAVIGAFIIGEYFEAAAVTYLFYLGNHLEIISLNKTKKELKKLMDLKPLKARLLINNEEIIKDINEIKVNDLIRIKPGEKVPIDGNIINGYGILDEQMLTGESIPIDKTLNDQVFSGTILTSGYIDVSTTKLNEDTELNKIIELVEDASDNQSKTEKFINKFSKYYTPLIIILSVFVYLFTNDIKLAITMLVISCPGALVISTPVSIVSGIGNGAKKGILFKGGETIEALSAGDIVLVDKTGTLTYGKMSLKEVKTFNGFSKEEVIKLVAVAQKYSEHPLSSAIIDYAKSLKINYSEELKDIELIIGSGIKYRYQKINYYVGNLKIAPKKAINNSLRNKINEMENKGLTVIGLYDEFKVIALFGIADTIRENSISLIKKLKNKGIKKVIMLTGDNENIARIVSDELNLDKYYANLLPIDKLKIIETYQQKGYKTIFIGDGINDAPALSKSNVGIALKDLGKDIAAEAADIVIVSENIEKVEEALTLSKAVKVNMFQNIMIALIVVIILILGVIFQVINMAIGMLVHEISVIVVILNAIRLLSFK